MAKAHNTTVQAWRRRNRDRTRVYNRRQALKRQGWTCEQYEAALHQQGGVCAICLQPETMVKRGMVQPLAADHDHTTGRARGLLCSRCNSGLGMFGDDPVRMRAAIDYFLQHQEVNT